MHRIARPIAVLLACLAALEGAVLHLAHHGHCHGRQAVSATCQHRHSARQHEVASAELNAGEHQESAAHAGCLACRYLAQRFLVTEPASDLPGITLAGRLAISFDTHAPTAVPGPSRARAPPRIG